MTWKRPALVAILMLTAFPAHAQRLRDGTAWMRANDDQRFAYLSGISDTISAGARFDERNASAAPRTFLRQAQTAMRSTTLAQGVQTITAWYRAHPNEMSKPVISVMWRELAMPHLSGQ